MPAVTTDLASAVARRKAVVVISFEEYERLSKVPSFGELLAAFPGDPDDIPERNQKPSRSYDQEL